MICGVNALYVGILHKIL